MHSTYGENIKLTIYGESHGPSIGMILKGIPAGLPVDLSALQAFMDRRVPGRNAYSTQRKENDVPHFLSGITNGFTNGDPIEAGIYNQDVHSADYASTRDYPRPGHADYTDYIKNGSITPGGGHYSGRMTAPMCIAGGLCLQWLNSMAVHITAHIRHIGGIEDKPFHPVSPEIDAVSRDFPVIDPTQGAKMREAIMVAQAQGDSVGGVIECAAVGLRAGIGNHMFLGMENRIAQIMFGIPAIKGIEFGDGFAGSLTTGSENNDSFAVHEGKVVTLTNHCGGILGGSTNGMPLIFRVAVKPTPTIALPQQTVNLKTMEEHTIVGRGRHDPCIVPRAVPVVEAAAAIAIFDAYLSREVQHGTE